MKKLPEKESDNNLASKNDEAYKHECEVRDVVDKYRKHGSDRVKKFILMVEKARGSVAAERLRNDALKLLKGDSHGNKT